MAELGWNFNSKYANLFAQVCNIGPSWSSWFFFFLLLLFCFHNENMGRIGLRVICRQRKHAHLRSLIMTFAVLLRGLGRFTPLFARETTLVPSCLLICTRITFRKGSTLKGKPLLPRGANAFFFFRVEPFSEGSQNNKLTESVSIPFKELETIKSFNISTYIKKLHQTARMWWRTWVYNAFSIAPSVLLAHLSWKLKVSFCDHSPSVVVVVVVRMSVRPQSLNNISS